MLALKEKLPCASSSDFWVRPHMVTLPARPLISAGEWLMMRNFTIGAWFLGSLTKRTPVTSLYFCSGVVLAPGFAAGLSTVAMGAGPLPAEPRLVDNSAMIPNTTPPMASAQRIVITHTGRMSPDRKSVV